MPAESAVKAVQKNKSALHSGETDSADSKSLIAATHTSELIIALCGPIGSPLHDVSETLKRILKDKFHYESCVEIRMSELIAEFANKVGRTIPTTGGFAKIQAQIDAGNDLRESYGAGILAELAVNQIRLERETHKDNSGSEKYVPRRVCYVIDSVKNQEELDLLRSVYRQMLYVIGVFSPLPDRVQRLKKKGLELGELHQVIDRDSGEETSNGQTVQDTFPQSDFFLRMAPSNDSQIETRIERYLNLIFGVKVVTPTFNETAMYSAACAAANSGCLSRQVGAAVANNLDEIVSTGWNDVPRAGGGLYIEDGNASGTDMRCWNLGGGKCFNDEEKTIFADAIVDSLKGFIPAVEINKAKASVASNRKLRGLIEFSRSVHAEMHAILNAGMTSGSSIRNGKLFVTTYPCHSCARHIVASGITEVYYIEPYRKSLAIKLHGDALTESETEKDKVRLLPFDGVAPARYLDLFKVPPNSRKKDGKMIQIAAATTNPRLVKSMQAFPELEGLVIKSLFKSGLLKANNIDSKE